MHSRIIALNSETNETEMFEMMHGDADYVIDRGLEDDWGFEILERIGTVDRKAATFKADAAKVRAQLEVWYDEYLDARLNGFEDFADDRKVYHLRSVLDEIHGIRVFSDWSGWPDTFHGFVRDLYSHPNLMDKVWEIKCIYDYHF